MYRRRQLLADLPDRHVARGPNGCFDLLLDSFIGDRLDEPFRDRTAGHGNRTPRETLRSSLAGG